MGGQDSDTSDGAIPVASAAAFTPRAAPLVKFESRVLTLDGKDSEEEAAEAYGKAVTNKSPVAEAPQVAAKQPLDRLAVLRDLARKLRGAPDSEETLQLVIDETCRCTRSDAAMLNLSAPISRRFVCGTALGAGPYVSVALRAGGPSFGEIVLTRLAEGADYEPEDETFAELVAEYVAKAVTTLRSGTVITHEEQNFIDRVTDELRSPLAGAISTIDAASGGEAAGSDARRYLRAAHGDLRRMLATVDNLMLLAHLRPPKLSDMETVAVGPWLGRAVAKHAPAAAEREVTVSLAEPEGAPLVSGVAEQLDRVAGELVANAIKFTDAQGSIEVSAEVSDKQVEVVVSDTGIGFDPGEAARMTDCFSRSLIADAGRFPGLGVGLFLAQQIVEQHGGRLWLRSRRDEGTQVHVALPRRQEGV